ncbi:MAG: hypothetical protein ACLS2V_12685 [Clostridium paraputrificum]|uniref:hypothetical protein n=1 Tax=Clostridium sp. TaxID=1506 RepID=UPI0025C07A44|nr:hypothetical protein [Clostridium sp.]MBS5926140.1 hypothetical protein [Clostridium sp.]
MEMQINLFDMILESNDNQNNIILEKGNNIVSSVKNEHYIEGDNVYVKYKGEIYEGVINRIYNEGVSFSVSFAGKCTCFHISCIRRDITEF